MTIAYLPLIYPLLGMFFGLLFVFCLVNLIDPHARGGSFGFRMIILLPSIILWPAVLIFFLVRIHPHSRKMSSTFTMPAPNRTHKSQQIYSKRSG